VAAIDITLTGTAAGKATNLGKLVVTGNGLNLDAYIIGQSRSCALRAATAGSAFYAGVTPATAPPYPARSPSSPASRALPRSRSAPTPARPSAFISGK